MSYRKDHINKMETWLKNGDSYVIYFYPITDNNPNNDPFDFYSNSPSAEGLEISARSGRFGAVIASWLVDDDGDPLPEAKPFSQREKRMVVEATFNAKLGHG
jgi:hypothetical protein